MYYNYDEYMRGVLGYPNCGNEEMDREYRSFGQASNIARQEYIKRNFSDFYPSVYFKIVEELKKECENLYEPITKDDIYKISFNVYMKIEQKETRDNINEQNNLSSASNVSNTNNRSYDKENYINSYNTSNNNYSNSYNNNYRKYDRSLEKNISYKPKVKEEVKENRETDNRFFDSKNEKIKDQNLFELVETIVVMYLEKLELNNIIRIRCQYRNPIKFMNRYSYEEPNINQNINSNMNKNNNNYPY